MYYLSDFSTANFSRRKGDKDKKKRQSKLGKLFNGELNPATGKRNVTLREPVIKHSVGGSVIGGVLGTGIGALVLANADYKQRVANAPLYFDTVVPGIRREPVPGLKITKKNVISALKSKPTKAAIAGGALVGAGLGVKRYLNRRSDIKKYEVSHKK